MSCELSRGAMSLARRSGKQLCKREDNPSSSRDERRYKYRTCTRVPYRGRFSEGRFRSAAERERERERAAFMMVSRTDDVASSQYRQRPSVRPSMDTGRARDEANVGKVSMADATRSLATPVKPSTLLRRPR